MAAADLARQLECSSIIRSRFRRGMSWLQWPNSVSDATAEEGEEPKVEKHPVCTKSLELNADALLGLLDWANGGFVDIPALQNEAIISQHHTVK